MKTILSNNRLMGRSMMESNTDLEIGILKESTCINKIMNFNSKKNGICTSWVMIYEHYLYIIITISIIIIYTDTDIIFIYNYKNLHCINSWE